jgi:hypothetical protein
VSKKKWKQGEAIVFEPNFKPDERHPLRVGEIVYFLTLIPNVPGHCIVTTWSGKTVPMVHPQDFRKATDDEL